MSAAILIAVGPGTASRAWADGANPLFAAPARTQSSASYPEPVVQLTPGTLRRFDDALPALARQAHVAFVCEGQPFHLELTEAQARDLSRQFGTSGLPLQTAVEQVAAAYDYDAVRTGPGVFLLNKRYTEAEDLPDVPYEESATDLRNILKSVQPFVPPVSSLERLRDLYQASSDAERAQLAQGLPLADLSEDQRHTVWQVACSLDFQYLHALKWVSRRLDACHSPSSVFGYQETLGVTYPAYIGPFLVVKPDLTSYALSEFVRCSSGGGTSFDPRYYKPAGGKLVRVNPSVLDPTTPRTKVPVESVSALRTSLQEAAARLSRRYTSSRPDRPAVTVDAALTPKTVCLAGEEFAQPDELMQALADVYGLRVRREDGVATLALPEFRVVLDPAMVGAEVRRQMPLPFLEKVNTAAPGEQFPKDPDQVRAHGLYVIAIRRAREIVEPEIAKRPDHRLPVMAAPEEARRMVALASLATLSEDFGRAYSGASPRLSHFDRCSLRMEADKKDPYAFVFSIFDPSDPTPRRGRMGVLAHIPPAAEILPE